MASEKSLKIKYYNLCTKLNMCGRYQGKTRSINPKLVKKKLASSNCDLSAQCCLEKIFVTHSIWVFVRLLHLRTSKSSTINFPVIMMLMILPTPFLIYLLLPNAYWYVFIGLLLPLVIDEKVEGYLSVYGMEDLFRDGTNY